MAISAAATTARSLIYSVGTPSNSAVSFNGTSLNIDHATCISQHDVVYLSPPRHNSNAMPIGDGDIGATVWCPGYLQMQIQKSDLWADPPPTASPDNPGPAANWRQVSAGAVAIHSEPEMLSGPTKFVQRLSLYTGIMTIQSDGPVGSCQITSFVSATAGVVVIRYQDQTLRNIERHIELSQWRDGHVFALGETVGVLQSLRDRRYAMIARAEGKRCTAKLQDRRTAHLIVEPSRSTSFTVYIATATSARDGDPVAVAKSRIDTAMARGYEELLREHKQHWALFWQKSFVRLRGPQGDPTGEYLENLWHLGLYQLACCMHGYDAPLSNGATWLNAQDLRTGPALYEGPKLRAMIAPLLPSNHLELTVPYVETYHRLLPEVAAKTGTKYGVSGTRFPTVFNRFGVGFDQETAHSAGDGLEAALIVWQAWRYAPDPFFLREKAYPLLRSCTTFVLEHAETCPESCATAAQREKLALALRALLWASLELELDEEMRAGWEAGLRRTGEPTGPYTQDPTVPLDDLTPADASVRLSAWIASHGQTGQGFFTTEPHTPNLAFTGQLCAAVNSILLREERLPEEWAANAPSEILEGFGGMPPGVLRIFPCFPMKWSGGFVLLAPGGFRVVSEANDGVPRYVAVKSMLGGSFRIFNPWGAGVAVKISNGHARVQESDEEILYATAQAGETYTIERTDTQLSRALRVRMTGRRNDGPKILNTNVLGASS